MAKSKQSSIKRNKVRAQGGGAETADQQLQDQRDFDSITNNFVHCLQCIAPAYQNPVRDCFFPDFDVNTSGDAIVRIWENHHELRTGHFGHASVSLRHGGSGGRLLTDWFTHISWFPDSAGLTDGFTYQHGNANTILEDCECEMSERTARRLATHARGLPGGFAPSALQFQTKVVVRHDPLTGDAEEVYSRPSSFAEEWGVLPEHNIKVPSFEGRNHPNLWWGVSVQKMAKWFENHCANDRTYRLASSTHSCAGIAAVALEAGGAGAYSDRPVALVYLTPNEVRDWTREIVREIQFLNQQSLYLLQEYNVQHMRAPHAMPAVRPGQHIMSLADFKAHSALGRFQPRSRMLTQIDTHLEKFHQGSWASDFPKKMKHLGRTMQAIIRHRQTKADSQRKAAIINLGKQILDFLDSDAFAQYMAL